MRKYLFFVFFLLCLFFVDSFNSSAQYVEQPKTQASRKFHLGIGTGLNNYTGILGPSIEYQVYKGLTIFSGIGLGSWGYKVSGGARYYLDYPRKWAFGLGTSYITGLKDFEFSLETTSSGIGQTSKVLMDINPVTTLNLSALYFIKLGSKNRLNFEVGYCLPISGNGYEIKNGYTLSSQSLKVMELIQPGGITIGLNFSFGL